MHSYVPSFKLRTPSTLAEALDILAREPGAWRPFAGGTDIMVLLEAGKLEHRRYLNIWDLAELRGITATADRVTLGALTTYTDILGDSVLRTEFPMLSQAARETGGVAIQNRGTLGGNIANASPAADSSPALLAYDAQVELVSASGTRTVPYSAFHSGYKQIDLRGDELIRAIHLPRAAAGEIWRDYFRKVGTRKAQAISKVCFAMRARLDFDGELPRLAEVRVALGSVAPAPIRCPQTERFLAGRTLDPDTVGGAGVMLSSEIAPIDDIRSTSAYRRRVAVNLLEDALLQLSGPHTTRRRPARTANRRPPLDSVLRSQRVVHSGGCTPAAIVIRDGLIAEILSYDNVPSHARVVDCKNSVIMPGLVDPHVHINDPGRAHWEGFSSATRAAASGGVTTLVDMPLNSIPATTSMAGLAAKREAARGRCWTNVHLWGGVVPGNTTEIEPMWNAGVLGFKCFLVPSGVDEFPHVTESDLRQAMPILSRLGAPLLVHAEMPGPIEHAEARERDADRARPASRGAQLGMPYARYLATRPRAAEQEAIELMIRLCREFRTRVHIVHLSSADAVPALRDARLEGLPITVETCPHYLTFCAEEIPDGGTHFKCAPPIRERENRERLWRALEQGVIDFVASDHSPCPPEMKHADSGDFLAAWGGIASLGLTLPVFWTAARARGYSLPQVSDWLSAAPANFCAGRSPHVASRIGRIEPGAAADLVVWDPDSLRPWRGYHRMTPYAFAILYGVVEQTYVAGRLAYDHGETSAEPEGICGIGEFS